MAAPTALPSPQQQPHGSIQHQDVENDTPFYQLKIYNIENTRAKIRVYFHLVGNTRSKIENTREKARVYYQLFVAGGVYRQGSIGSPPCKRPPVYTRKLAHALQL